MQASLNSTQLCNNYFSLSHNDSHFAPSWNTPYSFQRRYDFYDNGSVPLPPLFILLSKQPETGSNSPNKVEKGEQSTQQSPPVV
ncbi:MAG: hypothetical protein AAF770_01655 [Bacteroidota bacterium]